jgi:hypothetical protein
MIQFGDKAFNTADNLIFTSQPARQNYSLIGSGANITIVTLAFQAGGQRLRFLFEPADDEQSRILIALYLPYPNADLFNAIIDERLLISSLPPLIINLQTDISAERQ